MKTKFIVEQPLEERAEIITEFYNTVEEDGTVVIHARAVGGKADRPIVGFVPVGQGAHMERYEINLKNCNELGLRSDVKNRIYIEENP